MRILLVDDDASVLQALMALLKTIPGHDVRVAANSQKAHEHAANLGGVDLLISDVVMEPTDGFTMRAELQAMYPKMQTVFISGYDLSDYGAQLDGAHVVTKPVDARVIRGIVENSIHQLVAAATAHHAAAQNPHLVARAEFAAVPKAVAPEHPTVIPQTVAYTQPVVPYPEPNVGIPSAAPRAVAQPQAVPQPVAVAQPQAVAQATPTAQPQATGMPPVQAMPQVQPMPGVQPRAVAAQPAAAKPAAVQSGIRAAAQPVLAVAGSSTDPLVGVQLGDYRVQQLLGHGIWGSTYLAIQLSVNRPVGLKVLDLSTAQDDSARSHFLSDARAKAAVQHPFIVSVFEADERNGLVFYTHEYLDGATLEDLINQGAQLDEKTALQILKVAGEGLNYLWSHNLAHSPFDGKSIRMGKDNMARLANLATSQADPNISIEYEIQAVASLVSALVPSSSQSAGLRALLLRMSGESASPITSWPIVLQAVKALEPKVVPVEAAKIKAADQAALRAIESARVAQKRALVIQLCTLGALLLVVAFFIWKFLVSNKRNLTQQIEIPAGKYFVGSDNTQIELGAFDIDKYEVTIGDYAEFIDFCKAEPANEHKYDHERGARHLLHSNEDVLKLIGNAKQGNNVFKSDKDPGVKVDLNCPMVGVTFWDAWAYAKWKGRDLPTEEEWEAAARGPKGNKYPWGDELEIKRFNSNEGYVAMVPGQSVSDGYNYWSPVDAFSGDESPLKVVGMAGNVSEWVYRKEGPKETPLLKGGSFATPPIAMFERLEKILAEDGRYIMPASQKPKGKTGPIGFSEFIYVNDPITPTTKSLYIGFRTVKRK